jgi:rSAM/selenodomain-associated transferase 2
MGNRISVSVMADQIDTIPLSIIVPVLNEADRLPDLFVELERQHGVSFELILSDGGSSDGTPETGRRLAENAPFTCRIVNGPPGRGRQMNAGARESRGRALLFLHADSLFPDPQGLASGLEALDREIDRSGSDRIAGHFALRFRRENPRTSLAYYFYEVKACLSRPGTIHGDQGFLLRENFFQQVGPFDETLGYMEDDRLAGQVFRKGRWMLLPAVLETSARRFEREGFWPRQILNALIISLETAGRNDFLQALPALYRQQKAADRLRLGPFFAGIRRKLAALPVRERRHFWHSVGRLVAENLWQLFLLYDARWGFRHGKAPEQVPHRLFDWYEKRCKRLVESPAGYRLGILPAWLWFHCF